MIANAVDGAAFALPPVKLGSTIRVGMIGRIVDGKSVTEFLAAAESFQGDDRFQFVIVGNPATDQVRRAASKGIIQYLPGIPNDRMKMTLETFDVCVALSKYGVDGGGGGVSNALLEQMAAGRVIVAWDNPTYRQVLSEASAYLVPQGSVAGLIEALKSIMSDKASASARADAAMRKSQDFNWSHHVDRFLQLCN